MLLAFLFLLLLDPFPPHLVYEIPAGGRMTTGFPEEENSASHAIRSRLCAPETKQSQTRFLLDVECETALPTPDEQDMHACGNTGVWPLHLHKSMSFVCT